MKDIASRLEVGTMSLYYYISDKADLLTHMVGKIYADIEVPSPARPWRERMEAIAYQLYRGHQAVPGLDPHLFMLADPPLPAVLTVAQAAYDAAADGGLDPREAALTSRAVLGYAADRGASTAKRLAIRRANPAVRKMTAVDGTVDMVEGPSYAELVSDYDDVFSFGLTCLLDGVSAQVRRQPD